MRLASFGIMVAKNAKVRSYSTIAQDKQSSMEMRQKSAPGGESKFKIKTLESRIGDWRADPVVKRDSTKVRYAIADCNFF